MRCTTGNFQACTLTKPPATTGRAELAELIFGANTMMNAATTIPTAKMLAAFLSMILPNQPGFAGSLRTSDGNTLDHFDQLHHDHGQQRTGCDHSPV